MKEVKKFDADLELHRRALARVLAVEKRASDLIRQVEEKRNLEKRIMDALAERMLKIVKMK